MYRRRSRTSGWPRPSGAVGFRRKTELQQEDGYTRAVARLTCLGPFDFQRYFWFTVDGYHLRLVLIRFIPADPAVFPPDACSSVGLLPEVTF